tara:strand:- start:738 stop:1028 length:291 start_codon:yes stop_codon:yes gene_type:complete
MKPLAFEDNYVCKSDLIREVYKRNPLDSNHQIKEKVQNIYRVDVGSNLIIAAIGKFKDRKLLAPAFQSLKEEAARFLKKYNNNLEQAFWYLKQAAV